MTHRSRLKLASFSFAVLWTIWMLWSLAPLHAAEIGLLVASGAVAGLGWHWLYGAWYRWYFAGHLLPRKRAS